MADPRHDALSNALSRRNKDLVELKSDPWRSNLHFDPRVDGGGSQRWTRTGSVWIAGRRSGKNLAGEKSLVKSIGAQKCRERFVASEAEDPNGILGLREIASWRDFFFAAERSRRGSDVRSDNRDTFSVRVLAGWET